VLVTPVEEDIRAFFAENAGLADALFAKGFVDPVDAVRPEFARVAGFKFPLVRGRDELCDRLVVFNIAPREQEKNVRRAVHVDQVCRGPAPRRYSVHPNGRMAVMLAKGTR
jgi:hypothetical protein